MATRPQKGESKLKPRARIIRTIGDELISNEVVAIIELVKNSYDADATKVTVRFEGDLRKGKGRIIIVDNGSGMSLDIIREAWMEPATTFKKVKTVSKKGRKVLGEKGIGRFASAKLADTLKIITKKENDNEVVAYFNWGDFEDDKYLDQINCKWEVRKPVKIEKHGTILILEPLSCDWNYTMLRQMYTGLSRLINPVKPINDFEIELILPEHDKELKKLSGVVQPPASLGKPDYKLTGKVLNDGTIEATYFSKKKNKEEKIKEKVKLKPDRKISCGPFEFDLRVWDREQENLKKLAYETGSSLRDVRRDLNEASGISVYRNNFRIFPYGEAGNDWLRLDIRRVQNPSMRVSNNQVVGYVSISYENNPALRDQSNREGIIHSQELTDFRESILFLLSLLEKRRRQERKDTTKDVQTKKSLFSSITLQPVREVIERKLPKDREVKETLDKTEREIKEGIKKVQEVLARYRRLSTLGQLLDVVIHDGNKILYGVGSQILLIEKEFSKNTIREQKIKEYLAKLKNSAETLSLLFRRLEPFGGRKRGKPKEFIIEEAIKNVFALHQQQLEKLNIHYEINGPGVKVKLDRSEVELMFVNLLQNSIYWLDSSDIKQKKIIVNVYKNDDFLEIIFSDNGPGVKKEDVPYIFDPYYTTKPDGIGLGLTSVGELVTEYNGSLELVSNGPLDGATFRLIFRRRI